MLMVGSWLPDDFGSIVESVVSWILIDRSATGRRNSPKCFVDRGGIISHQLGKFLF